MKAPDANLNQPKAHRTDSALQYRTHRSASGRPVVATGRDEIAKAWQDARTSGLQSSDGTVKSKWNRPMIAVGAFALLWVMAVALT
ncbi:hypothetical protein [Arthrobacter sp. TE12232]